MPNRKQSREERLKKKRIAERKRKEKIKKDPEKAEELRRKERERYHTKKIEKKIIPISEMRPRDRRQAQRKKKIANKAYYEKKKRSKILAANFEKNNPSVSHTFGNIYTPVLENTSPQIQDKPNEPSKTSPTRISRIDLSNHTSPHTSPHPSTCSANKTSIRSRNCHKCRSPDVFVRDCRRIISPSVDSNATNDTNTNYPRSPEPSLSRNIFTSSPIQIPIKSPSVSSYVSSIHSESLSGCNSPTSDSSLSSSTLTKKFRKYQYKIAKETKLLQRRIMELRKEKDTYRKRAERAEKLINIKMQKTSIPANKPLKTTITSVKDDKRLRNIVINFLEDDEHSRVCPGKNDVITRHKQKKQKRYLTDSLKNLHCKYISSGNPPVSYTTFCRMRPFWIKQPDLNARSTCLCQIHANMELIIAALKKYKIINENCTSDILKSLCCDKGNVKCLMRQCELCKNRQVLYREFDNSNTMIYWIWKKISKTYIKNNEQKQANAVEKVRHLEKPLKVIKIFENLLTPFLLHCGNIKNQYNSIKHIKENMSDNECLVHIDYSENYSTKYGEEIQSVHFGASRQQLTLHTAVIYYCVSGQLKTQAFCTVSSSLRHDAPAVWAHLVPLLAEIEKMAPQVTTLHIVSDSPSAQYRNKKIFHIISQLKCYCPSVTCIVWHYCECGHGKGAPDGVGGVLKRTADKFVAYGNDIITIDSLIEHLQSSVKAVKIIRVEDYEITEKDWLIPDKLKPFPGTMKVHQAIWTEGLPLVIALRALSCVESQCVNNLIECPHVNHLGFYNLSDTTKNVRSNDRSQLADPISKNPSPIQRPTSNLDSLANQTVKISAQTSKKSSPTQRQTFGHTIKINAQKSKKSSPIQRPTSNLDSLTNQTVKISAQTSKKSSPTQRLTFGPTVKINAQKSKKSSPIQRPTSNLDSLTNQTVKISAQTSKKSSPTQRQTFGQTVKINAQKSKKSSPIQRPTFNLDSLTNQTVKISAQKSNKSSSSLFPGRVVRGPTVGIEQSNIKRFRASEDFLLKFSNKAKPCTITSKDVTTDNQENHLNSSFLSQYDIDVQSDAVPSCSFFENITPSKFKKFETPKAQEENENMKIETKSCNPDYSSDSDLDIF